MAPLHAWLSGLVAIVNTGVGGAAWKPVRVLTAAALPANTYSSATKTKTANGNGTLTVDGVLLAVGDRFWDKDAVTGSERGLFAVTDAGSGSTPWKAIRASDAFVSADFIDGKTFDIAEGTQAGQVYQFTSNAPFVLDTDTPAIARETGVMHTDDVQTVTGGKTFGPAKLKQFNAGSTFSHIFASLATASRTMTMPDADFTVPQDSLVAHLAGTEVVTGAKRFTTLLLQVLNGAATFVHQFASLATADRTWTLPDVSDTAVGLAATQTLTNKTLTAPIIDAQKSSASGNAITDPGNAGAIAVASSGVADLVSAGAETRTLAAPTFIGQEITLCLDTFGGNCVVTVASAYNQAGNTVVTLTAAGQQVTLKGCTIAAARRWRLISNDGATLS